LFAGFHSELTDPSKAVGLLEEIQSVAQVRVNFVRSGTGCPPTSMRKSGVSD